MPDEEKNLEAGGGSKKIILFSGIGLAVLVGAAFLFTTFAVPSLPEGGTDQETEESAKDGEQGELDQADLIPYDLPVIIINVKGTGKKRMLKIQLSIGYVTSNAELAAQVIESKGAEIKDALTLLLIDKTMDDLEGRDNLMILREEINEELNNVIFPSGGGEVRKIFYNEFVIQ